MKCGDLNIPAQINFGISKGFSFELLSLCKPYGAFDDVIKGLTLSKCFFKFGYLFSAISTLIFLSENIKYSSVDFTPYFRTL